MTGFQYRYRGPRNTPEERGGKKPAYSRTLENEHAMLIERDLAVKLRDGTTIYANVFRPADEKPAPPIIAWTPYGKHIPFDPRRFPWASPLLYVTHDQVEAMTMGDRVWVRASRTAT